MCDSRQPTDGAGSEVIDSPTQVPTTAGQQLEAQGWGPQPLACSECGMIGGHTARCSAGARPVRVLNPHGQLTPAEVDAYWAEARRLEGVKLSADAGVLDRAAELLRDAYTGPGPSYAAAHDCDRLASWLRREAKKLSSGG